MAAETQSAVYMNETFADPLMAQQAFAETFDLDNPTQAAAAYAKIMKAHTQRQLQCITRTSSRRTQHNSEGVPATATLSPQSSTSSSSSNSADE